jgi:hypothetical protein
MHCVCCCRLPRGFDSDWEGGEQMSAMVSMRGVMSHDLMPVGGVAVTRDTINHWLLDSMCCDGYHVPRAYNCLQPLCVPAAFPRQLLPGTSVTTFAQRPLKLRAIDTPICFLPALYPVLLTSFNFQRLLPELRLAVSRAPAAAAPRRRGPGLTAGC